MRNGKLHSQHQMVKRMRMCAMRARNVPLEVQCILTKWEEKCKNYLVIVLG